jgi:hypothetical protein
MFLLCIVLEYGIFASCLLTLWCGAKIPYSNTIHNKNSNQTMHMLQKTIQGAAPKREKIGSSRLLQYIQQKHLKMAD